jgi:hypothetical protein
MCSEKDCNSKNKLLWRSKKESKYHIPNKYFMPNGIMEAKKEISIKLKSSVGIKELKEFYCKLVMNKVQKIEDKFVALFKGEMDIEKAKYPGQKQFVEIMANRFIDYLREVYKDEKNEIS